MKLTATEASEYEACPEGIHPAKLIWLLDLGMQETPFGTKHQIFLNFEALVDGTHYTIGKFYTASLNEKASLAKDLSSWRGKTIKPGDEIDLAKLLGQFCQVQVLENEKGKHVIKSLLPKVTQFESLERLLTEKDAGELPEFFQELLAKQINPPTQPKRLPGGIDNLHIDDEVPF